VRRRHVGLAVERRLTCAEQEAERTEPCPSRRKRHCPHPAMHTFVSRSQRCSRADEEAEVRQRSLRIWQSRRQATTAALGPHAVESAAITSERTSSDRHDVTMRRAVIPESPRDVNDRRRLASCRGRRFRSHSGRLSWSVAHMGDEQEKETRGAERSVLAIATGTLLAIVVKLPVFPTVTLTRSQGAWSGGDRISWGMKLTTLREVFHWSGSWRGHQPIAFALVCLFALVLSVGTAAYGGRAVARAVRERAFPWRPGVPAIARSAVIAAGSFVTAMAIVILVVEMAGLRSGGVEIVVFVVPAMVALFAGARLGPPTGTSPRRRALLMLAATPFAAALATAVVSLLLEAANFHVPAAVVAVVALAAAPGAVRIAREG
jgi:hypothetical protein